MELDIVRMIFADDFDQKNFVVDKTGAKVLEVIGTCITLCPSVSDTENVIFGEPNFEYIERELEWYKSQSLFVRDIPGKVPAIWEAVADKDGKINSNYGYLIWSAENHHQYGNVLEELRKNPFSRRAIMIYTRPIMHYDYNRNGMSDFVCTNTVQYLIRGGRLTAVVNMRSNDAIFGFRNDYHWQLHVLNKLAADLDVPVGQIIWQTGSLHVYERHFYLVDHYAETGELNISKEKYRELYPDSEYA